MLGQPKEALEEARLATQLQVTAIAMLPVMGVHIAVLYFYSVWTAILYIFCQPGLARAWTRLGKAAVMLGQEDEVPSRLFIISTFFLEFACHLLCSSDQKVDEIGQKSGGEA